MLPAEEAYTLLFSDSFFAAMFYPFDTELLFTVMVSFGGYGIYETVAWALFGSILGLSINFAIGKFFYSSRRFFNLGHAEETNIQKAVGIAKKYGIWLLLLNWNNVFGSMITFLAGMFNISWPVFMALSFIGRLAYYTTYLWLNGLI